MTARSERPGPSVVAAGGGHGLSTSLEALRDLAGDLTAVVSVADDGGSSGRLRRELGIMAPGDMRRCLAALTPPGLIRDALDHRFGIGALSGHPAGNVLLAALLENAEDPVVALDAAVAMTRARGRILPASRGRVDLLAETRSGLVRGQVAITRAGGITRVFTDPEDPPVPAEVEAAIAAADMVVFGPGSLYTSVLAAALPGIRRAVAASSATVVYVANLVPETPETPGFTLADHVAAVRSHGIEPDVVLVDEGLEVAPTLTEAMMVRPLRAAGDRHDPARLRAAFSELVAQAAT